MHLFDDVPKEILHYIKLYFLDKQSTMFKLNECLCKCIYYKNCSIWHHEKIKNIFFSMKMMFSKCRFNSERFYTMKIVLINKSKNLSIITAFYAAVVCSLLNRSISNFSFFPFKQTLSIQIH